MREQLNLLDIKGVVVIGEGERDEAPMLYIGEEVGTGQGPEVDIALDPLEGTTLTAKDMPNALTVIAMARREAKWAMASLRCAGQDSSPEQRHAAAPSSRTISEPHTGQRVGICHGVVPCGRRSRMTLTTSGITSPARRTITLSPTRTSRRAIWSALCNVALDTITPATATGASRATGVAAPVRPRMKK